MNTEDHTKDSVGESVEQSCLPDLLNDTLQGSSLAFSSIYSTLQKVKEQNQQLTQSMDMMMRYMIQTKFRIDAQIDTSEDSTRLIILLDNATDYSVQIAAANLVLTPITEPTLEDNQSSSTSFDIQENITLKHISASYTTTHREPRDSLFLPNLGNTSTPFLLPPYTSYREVLCINMTRPAPYYGRIDIQIPILDHESMKDGINPLHLTHSFGIYIIDQIKKIVVDKGRCDDQGDGIERIYNGDFIRHTLAIPPALGLEQGMRICLEMTSCVIVCRIESISFDTVRIGFFSENKVLLEILIVELDTLAS